MERDPQPRTPTGREPPWEETKRQLLRKGLLGSLPVTRVAEVWPGHIHRPGRTLTRAGCTAGCRLSRRSKTSAQPASASENEDAVEKWKLLL